MTVTGQMTKSKVWDTLSGSSSNYIRHKTKHLSQRSSAVSLFHTGARDATICYG